MSCRVLDFQSVSEHSCRYYNILSDRVLLLTEISVFLSVVNLATKVYRLGFDHEMVEWFIMIDVVWKIFWPWNGRMISNGKYFDHEMVEWFHTTSALQWNLANQYNYIGENKKSDSCLATFENSDHSSGDYFARLFNLASRQSLIDHYGSMSMTLSSPIVLDGFYCGFCSN